MKITRGFLKHLAIFVAFGLAVLTMQLVLMAHANGGTATVDITAYGERYLEVVLMFILAPILALGLHYYVVEEAS